MHVILISANLNENKELAEPNLCKFPLSLKAKPDCPTAGGEGGSVSGTRRRLSKIIVLVPALFFERVELTGGNVSVVLVKLRKRIGVACKAVVFLYNVCPAL